MIIPATHNILGSIIAVAAIALVSSSAHAQIQALNFTNDYTGGIPIFNSTYGWEFSVTSTVTVTDLGVYDRSNDGFLHSHTVGLWTSNGSLLADTILAAGASGTADVVSGGGTGAFRYNSIGPLVLGPGDYVVAASVIARDDDGVFFSTTTPPTTAPGINFLQLLYTTNGYTFPTTTGPGVYGAYNANFRIASPRSAATPEPGALSLLTGAGVACVGFTRSRRRKK